MEHQMKKRIFLIFCLLIVFLVAGCKSPKSENYNGLWGKILYVKDFVFEQLGLSISKVKYSENNQIANLDKKEKTSEIKTKNKNEVSQQSDKININEENEGEKQKNIDKKAEEIETGQKILSLNTVKEKEVEGPIDDNDLYREDEENVKIKTIKDLDDKKQKDLVVDKKNKKIVTQKTVKDLKENNIKQKDHNFLKNLKFVLEKKGKTYHLWIKKGTYRSIALITPPYLWKRKRKYYLRSTQNIKNQNDNMIFYKNKKIGPKNKLYFLASSKVEQHSILKKSYKIIIPKNMVYGYNKRFGNIRLEPGKTQITVRFFMNLYGKGKHKDVFFKLPKISDILILGK